MPLYNNAGSFVCLALIPLSTERAQMMNSGHLSGQQTTLFERIDIVTSRVVRPDGDVIADDAVRSDGIVELEHDSAFLACSESCKMFTALMVWLATIEIRNTPNKRMNPSYMCHINHQIMTRPL